MPTVVDTLLGAGNQERSSGTSNPDAVKGRHGSLNVYRNVQNGRATFTMVLDIVNGATSAKVVRYDIEGFGAASCKGRIICARNAILANPVPLNPVAGGVGAFDPAAHDNGILTGLIGQCGCKTASVVSYKLLVTVQVLPPNAPPIADLKFPICY